MTSTLLSNCCNSNVLVGGEGTTHWYYCDKCEKACDTHKEELNLKYKTKEDCDIVSFGEYKGTKFAELPIDYVNWLWDNVFDKNRMIQ